MFNSYTLLFILFILLYVFLSDKNITENMFDEKDDVVIRFKNLKLSLTEANSLYNILFVSEIENNLNIVDVINSLKLSVATYLIVQELCLIINDKGIRNGLPWIDENAMTPLQLSGMTVEKLQSIYNYNKSINNDFRTEFIEILSPDQYYTLFDILHYNHYHSTLEEIINRHPLLYAHKSSILDLNQDINVLLHNKKVNFKEGAILNNLSKDLSQDIKVALAKAIYQNLCVEYDDNDTILKVFDKLNIINKHSVLFALSRTMNKLTLFITPNHDYSTEESLILLGNTTIKSLNENLFNIRYYKDLHYLRNANIGMSHGNAFILLNILYKRYDVLGDKINKTLDNIGPNKDNLLLDEILSSDLKITNHENVNETVKHIKTLIKRNHSKVPYNILLAKVTKYTQIKDVSKMLLFGI